MHSLAALCTLMAALAAEVAPQRAAGPEWQPWSEHSAACSTTCGQGVRCRRRVCAEASAAGPHVEVNMDSCPGGERSSRDCLPCRAYVECPQNGAWGDWGEWSDCLINAGRNSGADENEKAALKNVRGQANAYVDGQSHGVAMPKRGEAVELDPVCGKGLRNRTRACDQPPPGPFGLLCSDQGRQESEVCEVQCASDQDFLTPVTDMLTLDLQENPNQLVYVNFGAPAALDCQNDAFELAQRSVKAYQDLQIQWRQNNESVTALVSRMQKILDEMEEEKGLPDSKKLSGARNAKLETAQVRSFGTQLTIDPVDGERVGLYACYMVLDGEHYLMRSFTLLTRQLPVRQFMETESVDMPTNAETFMDARLPALEWALIRWYHNGLPRREQILADWNERDWKINIAYGDTGAWECYMVLGERQWKTNEFQLAISEEASFVQKFDDAYAAYFMACCALILYAVAGFPLAVITLRQREDNWLTAEEQRCIEYVRQINYLYMARYVRKIS